MILSGRTKISVDENGRERILAERGPGQLVGERAALQISVRSANVIALDTVQALVVRTGDFAAFISAHPAVLGIVESQFYDRSREDPVRSGRTRCCPASQLLSAPARRRELRAPQRCRRVRGPHAHR